MLSRLQAELCEPLTDEEVKLYSKNGKVRHNPMGMADWHGGNIRAPYLVGLPMWQVVHLVHADIFALHLRELNFNKKRIRRYVLLYRFRPDLCIAEAEDEACSAESFV